MKPKVTSVVVNQNDLPSVQDTVWQERLTYLNAAEKECDMERAFAAVLDFFDARLDRYGKSKGYFLTEHVTWANYGFRLVTHWRTMRVSYRHRAHARLDIQWMPTPECATLMEWLKGQGMDCKMEAYRSGREDSAATCSVGLRIYRPRRRGHGRKST